MVLPSTGPISVSQIEAEFLIPAGTTRNFCQDLGPLIGIPYVPPNTTAVSLSNFRGITATGIVEWLATQNFNTPTKVSHDTVDNIYITGTINGNVTTAYNATSSTGTNSTFLTAVPGAIGLVKYNSSGIVTWITTIDGTGNDNNGTIAVNRTVANGNIYLSMRTGTTLPTAYSAGLTTGVTSIATGTGSCIAKYNYLGAAQYILIVSSGGGTGQFPTGLSIDASENVYIACRAVNNQTLTAWGAGGTTSSVFTPAGTVAGTGIIKWNSAGTVQWMACIMGQTTAGYGINCATFGNTRVYVCGTCTGQPKAYNASSTTTGITCTGTSGITPGSVIASYNITTGNPVWVTMIYPTTQVGLSMSLTTDTGGNIFITGTSTSGVAPTAITAGLTTGLTASVVPVNTGAYLCKYDASGVIQWITTIDGTGADSVGSVSIDSSGNIYVTVATASGTAVKAWNAGSTTVGITSVVPFGSGTAIIKYSTAGVALRTAIIYNSAGIAISGISVSTTRVYVNSAGSAATWNAFNAGTTAFKQSTNANTGILAKYYLF